MIRSFKHKGIEQFFKTGSKAGIQPPHAKKLRVQLELLNRAKVPEDMNLPTWQWHPLKGDMAGRWAVSVNGNWHLTYAFEGGDAVLVGYEDYH
ncbi:MAG TPA: type II toxin-antitoxin system RelE/ParE family toxin [Steroidobacteraceae bacterium]|jgi:proteic killer suppression protein